MNIAAVIDTSSLSCNLIRFIDLILAGTEASRYRLMAGPASQPNLGLINLLAKW
jgi:hypothetical protein